MPQAPKSLDPSLSAQHRFGAELRRWRELRGLSQAALARLIHVSPDLVAKVEKAARRPSSALAETCDELLGANGSLAVLWPAIEREHDGRRRSTSPTDPEMAAHWFRMLTVLATTDNAIGVRGLPAIVTEELRLLDRLRGTATGQLRRQFGQVQARWLEFASWVADNSGDPDRAALWLAEAGELAAAADDEAVVSYVLMRRAQRAVEAADPALAVSLAESAVRNRRLPSRIKALSLVRAAQASALDGDRRAVRSRLALAHRTVEQSQADPEDEALAGHCTTAYVRAHEAHCLLLLGEPLAAIREYRDVLTEWPEEHRLDEALFRAQLALAHDDAGLTEEADAEAVRALALARQTGSERALNNLRPLAVRRLSQLHIVARSQFLRAWHDEGRARAAS